MNLVLLGSGAFGLPTFRSLARDHRIVGVVTQPDKPAGRGKRLTPTPIGQWARDDLPDVPLLKSRNINEPPDIDTVRAIDADAWIVIAFGQKLSQALLEGVFAVNLHASLLPRWRGAAPINAAILAGDAETGNSVITLAQRMDAGEILGQSTRPITPDLTAGDLHDLLAEDGPEVMLRVLADLANDTLRPVTQDESLVTLAPKLTKADGWVDFARDDAEICRRRVHGLTPWPGVSVTFRGKRLKLLRAQSAPQVSEQSVAPGTLVNAPAGLVACAGPTLLQLLEVQPEGGKPMSWSDFANGAKPEAGELLTGGARC